MDNRANICSAKTFAMPTYGRTAFFLGDVSVLGIDVPVRGGHLAALVAGTAQGTPVWRPPDC